MKTFVDRLSHDCEQDCRTFLAHMLGTCDLSLYANDGTLMRALVAEAAAVVSAPLAKPLPQFDQYILSFLAKFERLVIGPLPGHPEATAFAVDRALIDTFSDCRVSGQISRVADTEIRRREFIYIDIPHRALMLCEHVQVRALLVRYVPRLSNSQSDKTDVPPRSVELTAVLTPVGRNVWRYASWNWGQSELHPYSAGGPFPAKNRFNGKTGGLLADLQTCNVGIQGVMRNVEKLVSLTLVYAETAGDEAVGPPLPQLPAGHARRRGRRGRQVAKTFSLFAVRPLSAPRSRFGRGETESRRREGRKLAHRIRVRGHFRLQRYGKRRARRRLVWIVEHDRGPRDAPFRTHLKQLRAPDPEAANNKANDNLSSETGVSPSNRKEAS